jgi:nicotinamide-nucleotide amidase
MNLGQEVITLLRQRGETIAIAESLTGGSLAKVLTDFEGASHAFLGGVIAYSIESKLHDLDVPKETIDTFGPYSQETAMAMAEGAKRRFGSDWAISTTGVAGPGESQGVAAGEVWISIIGALKRENIKLSLNGQRGDIRAGAVEGALTVLARILRASD